LSHLSHLPLAYRATFADTWLIDGVAGIETTGQSLEFPEASLLHCWEVDVLAAEGLIPLIAQGLLSRLQTRTPPGPVLGNCSLPDAIPIVAQLVGVDDVPTKLTITWGLADDAEEGLETLPSASAMTRRVSEGTQISTTGAMKGPTQLSLRQLRSSGAHR
jgi:hypothetical protein